MALDPNHSYSVFRGGRRLASGALAEVAVAAARASEGAGNAVLVLDDATGEQVELDLRGSEKAVRARYAGAAPEPEPSSPARGRGRPRLGVVAREVTLLPEQWEWLAGQPGGASVALRKLVQDARRSGSQRERMRRAQERAYKAMVPLAGDRPGFEEATRSLFANDLEALRARMGAWPDDLREYILRLADPKSEDQGQDAIRAIHHE